ncbi:hypothetical protein GUJ93_ZPchr0013g34015 [Zizania palustris]|uniref:Uncharacterized protein n=1 Tax=Zizania palustris TaxID=103762 RepID=A0A8J6BZ87_ZIZPA|nr:hypothetical protein GUJ93_ZPchr0013g34015 [Zizania palustris]
MWLEAPVSKIHLWGLVFSALSTAVYASSSAGASETVWELRFSASTVAWDEAGALEAMPSRTGAGHCGSASTAARAVARGGSPRTAARDVAGGGRCGPAGSVARAVAGGRRCGPAGSVP